METMENMGDFMQNVVNTQYIPNIKTNIVSKIESYKTLQIPHLNFDTWNELLPADSYLKSTPDDIKQFMFYCNLIIHDLYIKTNFYDFNLKYESTVQLTDIESISKILFDHCVDLHPDKNIENILTSLSTINFINIIAFGRNFMYYLRYIIWICRHKIIPPDQLISEFYFTPEIINNNLLPLTCFFIVCDKESFNSYGANMANMNRGENTVRILKTHTEDDNIHLPIMKSFTEYLNIFETKEEFNKIYDDEILILKALNIKIFLVESDNYLMKGIGGKRGLINYYSYLLCNHIFNNDTFSIDLELYRNKFCTMTIDDNITGIYEITHNCISSNIRKSYCPSYISGETKDSIKKDKEHTKIMTNCFGYSFFTIYYRLKEACINYNMLICGIRKGSGDRSDEGERADESIEARNITYALYKLNIQKPYSMHNYGYFYNPFNCRFMEDIAFNALAYLSSKALKLGNYFLRFGHYYNVADKFKDYNDCFNKEIISEDIPITPIYGNYLMLYYYIYLCEHFGLIGRDESSIPYSFIQLNINNIRNSISNSALTPVELIKPTSKNKYNWMHMLVYHMLYVNAFNELGYYNDPYIIKKFQDNINMEYEIIKYLNLGDTASNNYLIENLTSINANYTEVKKASGYFLDLFYSEPGSVDSSSYHNKYLKYKLKYLNLLKNIK